MARGGFMSMGRGKGKTEKAKNVKGTLSRLLQYLGAQKLKLIFVMFLVLAATGLSLMGPFLLGVAIDGYIMPGNLGGLVKILAIMGVIYAINALISWLQMFTMVSISQHAVRDIRNDLFSKMQTLSLRFFDQRTHGELMSRLTNDIENISNTLSQSVTQLMSSVLTIIGVATMMIILSWKLAIVCLVFIPLIMFFTKWIAKYTRKGFLAQQQNLGDLNGMIEETISGQRVIKVYGQEEAVVEKFNVANEKLRKSAIRARILAGIMGPLMGLVNNASYAIVAIAGGFFAVQGTLTVGVIASFLNYAKQFTHPINQIAQLYNTIQSALAGAERVFEIMDEKPELTDHENAILLEDVKGEVVFEKVDFGYKKDIPVLKNVNFTAKPGQTIALVGPTGAGKTTIINLLTRFYDINNGSIMIDGQDLRDMKKDSLRSKLGIVLQDTYLFSGTVIENIRYGRLDATDEEVKAAAKLANAEQFIHRLTDGYDTLLNEEGSNLSLGQRQLLSIARAILADPAILILDEATSSVDTRTEMHIQEALLKLMEGRTSFVIAHRLSTIREADKILVISDGEIIEKGNHHELLDNKGFYYNLYTSQFKKFAS